MRLRQFTRGSYFLSTTYDYKIVFQFLSATLIVDQSYKYFIIKNLHYYFPVRKRYFEYFSPIFQTVYLTSEASGGPVWGVPVDAHCTRVTQKGEQDL